MKVPPPLIGIVPEDLVLAIDGGGSKTLLALADRNGRVVAVRRGGGTNPVDQPAWLERLATLIDGAPSRADWRAAAVGLAGLTALDEAGSAALTSLLPDRRDIRTDAQIAFDGAFQDRAGVLLIAGTGSIAWAQGGDGREVRVGGWGYPVGDEGGGYWIGHRALGLLTQALDGRLEAASFAEGMLAALDLAPADPPGALLNWVRTRTHLRAEVAALARTVDGLADAREPVASALLQEAACALAVHVETARRRLGQADAPWSHAGSLFDSVLVRDALARRIGLPEPPALPPVGGALWRAARLAGWRCDAAWVASVAVSLADGQASSVLPGFPQP